MARRSIIFFFLSLLTLSATHAQVYIKASDLFPRTLPDSRSGELNIIQDSRADTILSRYILGYRKMQGGRMEGFRIQIYGRSTRTAREEANKVRADFIVQFPDIPSYIDYAEPGYFLVRVGDFRTKIDGTKSLYQIRRKYPNAYMVPTIINFPDLNKE